MKKYVLAAGVASLCALGPGAAIGQALPHAVMRGGPPPESPLRDALFAFGSSSPVLLGSFECRLDDAAWLPCVSPHAVFGLADGGHVFQVRLEGFLANRTAAVWRWTVRPPPVAAPGAPSPPTLPKPAKPGRPGSSVTVMRVCAHADEQSPGATTTEMATAALCLLNAERAARHLAPLRPNKRLRAAAARHASEMTKYKYFAHTARDGESPLDRVRASGYFASSGGIVGEVMAWGTRSQGTPRGAVEALMGSPHHRGLILSPFADAGVAVVDDAPLAGYTGAATYVVDLGRRD